MHAAKPGMDFYSQSSCSVELSSFLPGLFVATLSCVHPSMGCKKEQTVTLFLPSSKCCATLYAYKNTARQRSLLYID